MSQYSVELGWMNLTPCSKIFWVDSSISGVKVPVLKTAEQRLYAWAVFNADNMTDETIQAAKECAISAVVVAGGIGGGVTANPVAALSAFTPAFLACFAGKFGNIVVSNVNIETRSQCMW